MQRTEILFPVLKRLVLVDSPDIENENVVNMVVGRAIAPLQKFGYTTVDELGDDAVKELMEAVGPMVKDSTSRVEDIFIVL